MDRLIECTEFRNYPTSNTIGESIMNLREALQRPEYIFRPSQIFRRFACEFRNPSAGFETVRLPWGLRIRLQPSEVIGSSICRMGIHELEVSECIGRLIEPGDLVVDAGANIGQMTSLMALRAGPQGEVIAFEPHPGIFKDLQHNISLWQRNMLLAPVTARSVALSDSEGSAQLRVPSIFGSNHGIAFITGSRNWDGETESCDVQVTVLDSSVGIERRVGLLKVDVEGNELKVLQGAERLIATASIRDVVFESMIAFPSPVSIFFQTHGYAIFRIGRTFFGPTLVPVDPLTEFVPAGTNYLATRDAQRAVAKIAKRGWAVFSGNWPA